MENVKVLLVGIRRYAFDDRESGRRIEGTKAHFLQLESQNEDNATGYIPSSANLPFDYYERFKKLGLPHVCNAVLTLQLTGNKPSVKVTDFVPVKPYKLIEA